MTGFAPFQHPPVVLLDGTAALPRDVLGNKGYGINAMRREGLPVPPAFCITTEVCARYFEEPDATTDSIRDEVRDKLRWLEAETVTDVRSRTAPAAGERAQWRRAVDAGDVGHRFGSRHR